MLELFINGQKYQSFEDVSIDLAFNSVASSFSIDFYFDPNNADHRSILRPGAYSMIEIFYNGQILLTGTILTPDFTLSGEPELVSIEGYSLPGILEDCNPPLETFPLDIREQNLQNIATKLINPFGIELVIDQAVQNEATKQYKKFEASETESVKKIISDLASQRNIVLTHNEDGALVMTKARTNQPPIGQIRGDQPGYEMGLNFNGQNMHSPIIVMGQASSEGGNASQAEVENPLVNEYRPTIAEQTSGDDVDTEQAARNLRSDELADVKLSIEIDRWVINDQVIKPNTIIRVQAPELFIEETTDFFIETVSLKLNSAEETASATAVLPEVYTGEEPKNIFG